MRSLAYQTRRAAWTALAALAFGGLAPGRAAAQLAVDQGELIVERPVGGGVLSFNVRNEGAQVMEATIYLADWERDESGEHRFLPSGTLRQSCARYLRVFPLSVRLPPQTSQAVRIALEGADSLRSACWSIVFVESGGTPVSGGRQISYVTRLGVKVYLLPPALPKEGEVEGMSVTPDDSGRQQVAVAFRNSGGLPLWVRGAVEYRKLDNSVAATDSLPDFSVLPGAARRLRAVVPRLASGRYVALALLDYGGAEIAAGQVVVEVR